MTSCKTVHGVSNACPPIREYTYLESMQIGRELKMAGSFPMLQQVVKDCHTLREQVRACATP